MRPVSTAKYLRSFKDETFSVNIEPLRETSPGIQVQLRGQSSDEGTRFYIDIVKQFITEYGENCCALIDLDGAKVEMKHSGMFARELRDKLQSPAAMIGLNPVLRIMMEATNKMMGRELHRAFKTRAEAVAWLTEQMKSRGKVAV